MKIYTEQELLDNGYEIQNAKITDVSLNMQHYGCLTLYITLEGAGWGVNYGGYCLGKGFLGAREFEGSAMGMESIMRIMDVVGVEDLNDLNGKYVRAALKNYGQPVKIIGNIIKDQWFDYESFFEGKTEETENKTE